MVAPSTVNGRLLTITPQGDTLAVNDATVIAADIVAENGIIHAIDRVLVPPLAEGVRPPDLTQRAGRSSETIGARGSGPHPVVRDAAREEERPGARSSSR